MLSTHLTVFTSQAVREQHETHGSGTESPLAGASHSASVASANTTAAPALQTSCGKDAKVLTNVQTSYSDGAEIRINPASRSEHDMNTRQLALEQTKAARKVFYSPGEAAQRQLSGAAKKLVELMDNMETVGMKRALSARLTGPEGLLKGQSFEDVRNALSRVDQSTNATANDRTATIEIMGTIGSLFVDSNAITRMQPGSEKHVAALVEHLKDNIPNLSESSVKEMKALGGSKAVGPLKSEQRARPSNVPLMRTGLHDLGSEADKQLGISKKDTLNSISWQLATIDKSRVKDTTEPLSGHMSGSSSEALVVFDALMGDEKPYISAYEKTKQEVSQNPSFVQKTAYHDKNIAEDKSARLALTTGYLVATGFHSAVEVAETALKYSGQNPRDVAYSSTQDAANWIGEGGATAMMKELFESHTATKPSVLSAGTRDKAHESTLWSAKHFDTL
ncbi:MAG: hypothetical protein P8Y45_21690 [Exilibacterium sp.]